jgi:hypothetical protein
MSLAGQPAVNELQLVEGISGRAAVIQLLLLEGVGGL